MPVYFGGSNDLENLAFACQGCNNIKFTKIVGIDPESNTHAPLFNPRKAFWAAHFAWDDSLLWIIGMSKVGRATVNSLKLNRLEVRNLRRLLLLIGEHPPIV
jgi:hypothetical protein